jgi:uncharacterized spore protein YtfJ
MSEQFKETTLSEIKSWEEGSELMEKLFDAAKPEAVYGKPLTVEGQTIITASEVTVGLGFGFGTGSGSTNEEGEEEEKASGSAGGGGGGAGSRPVAVIRISQEGVQVEPVMDMTKIMLAFLTTIGSIFLMGSKIQRAAKGR